MALLRMRNPGNFCKKNIYCCTNCIVIYIVCMIVEVLLSIGYVVENKQWVVHFI